MEETVTIPGPKITLEGRLTVGAVPGGAVVTHPHPLFGGDMANNVVLTATRALAARGMSALRFNFRGVGRSTGAYGALTKPTTWPRPWRSWSLVLPAPTS
jgi:uncharacterized protein